jgi:hypothetical protein
MQIKNYDPRLHFKIHVDSGENPSYKVSQVLRQAEDNFLRNIRYIGDYTYRMIPVIVEIERLPFKSPPTTDLHKESKEQSKLTIKQKLLLK